MSAGQVTAPDKDAPIPPRRRLGCVASDRVACPCATCGKPASPTHINVIDQKLTCGDCCPICRQESV